MRFEWDAKKAKRNLIKHGVSFEEASTVFFDALSATAPDPDHSSQEHRNITFGLSQSGKYLTVSHKDTHDTIRIITARKMPDQKENCMKKHKEKDTDELRKSYSRKDFDLLERGKYVARLTKKSNIVVLDPEVAKAFPNERAVNQALKKVIEFTRSVSPRVSKKTSARK